MARDGGRWWRGAMAAVVAALAVGPAAAQSVWDDPAFALYRHATTAFEARDYGRATALARGAIAAYPDQLLAYYLWGQAALAESRWEEAADAFGKLLARYPGSFAATRDLGIAYQQLGRVEDAAAAYEKALALRPEDGVRARLAFLLLNGGQQSRAVPVLRALADGGSTVPEVYLALGRIAFDQGEFTSSATAFQKALALRDDGRTWFNLGAVRLRQNNQDAALQAFERAAQHADTREAAVKEIEKIKSAGRQRPARSSRPGLPK